MKDWKVWALLVALFLLVKMCGGCNACSDDNANNESDGGDGYEYRQSSSSSSYGRSIASFSDEQDVRTYLCSHRFSSSDGYTLSFSNNADEVSINGQPLSSNVSIRSVSSNSAVIRTQGPYGNTTFRLSISGSDGAIEDTNDGEMYYSR